MGRHELTDIAVLRINANTSFPTVVLGYNDQPEVGEVAVALGSPFGLDQTVTAGIVSAVSRIVNGVPMVQTDAAILSEILSDSPAEALVSRSGTGSLPSTPNRSTVLCSSSRKS